MLACAQADAGRARRLLNATAFAISACDWDQAAAGLGTVYAPPPPCGAADPRYDRLLKVRWQRGQRLLRRAGRIGCPPATFG